MKILFISRFYNEALDIFSNKKIYEEKEIDNLWEEASRFNSNWIDNFYFLLKKKNQVKILYPDFFKTNILNNINKKIYISNFLEKFKPDLILSGAENFDFLELVKLNLNNKIPIILWKSSEIKKKNFNIIKNFYTHVITDNLYLKKKFTFAGIRSFFLLPSVSSSILMSSNNFYVRKNSIFFTGSLGSGFVERKKIISHLIKNDINLQIRSRDLKNNYRIFNYVNNFLNNFVKNKNLINNFFFKDIISINRKPLFGRDLFEYMKKFKFILNFHSDFDKNKAINYRVFESLAVGALLFTDANQAQNSLFQENKHLICYKNKDDLINKINYYKNNVLEAKQIALNGYNLIKKNHTSDVRLHDFIKILKKI